MSLSPSGGYENILEAIPALTWLNISFSNLSPYLGGRNFSQGCLLAVSQSLQLIDGHLAFGETSYFNKSYTIADVQDAATYGSLCTTNGTAPRVLVPYRWCEAHCFGWELSHYNSLQQWIGPLVQFILPCLAFCLSIPRGWKIALPQWIFGSDTISIVAFFTYPIKLTIAFVLVFCDTIIWLSICFAFAGPMLLSAVYEYILDGIIIDFLFAKPKIPSVTKARLLLAAVVGNIKLDQRLSNRVATIPRASTTGSDEIWLHIMGIAEELIPHQLPNTRPQSTDKVSSINGRPSSAPAGTLGGRTSSISIMPELERTSLTSKLQVGSALKLKALLNAQSRLIPTHFLNYKRLG